MKIASTCYYILRRIFYRFPGKSYCICCERSILGFLPFRGLDSQLCSMIKEFQIIGSDVMNFECPRCGSSDRERHLLAYFECMGLKDIFSSSKILHVAPELGLSGWIQRCEPAEYVKGDLNPISDEFSRLDLQDIVWEDAYFDVVIANHVLEHVNNDDLALREIVRVLKPGGVAIVQTPYSDILEHKFEDSNVVDVNTRRLLYGQEDHLRLYGRDIFEKIESYGFKSKVVFHGKALAHYDPIKFGMNENEPFMCFQKI